MRKPRVIIESPFRGDVKANTLYAQRALLDSISRGEAPFASHLLYTRVLNDADAGQRQLGLVCGFSWLRFADAVIVYADLGISDGMKLGIRYAEACGIPVLIRHLMPTQAPAPEAEETPDADNQDESAS